jgi:hypothetical protein
MTNDIAEFLTSRRATVTPEQAGLPTYGKRRVPGLRREEVASLAGVSIDYYRRLERMMFGALGQRRSRRVDPHHRSGARRRNQLHRHRRHLLAGRVRGDRRQGPCGRQAGERRARHRGLGVENSLRRLGTDWIDLYQVHRYEPGVDIDETLGALSDLVHQGKVRYVGHSTFPRSAIVEAQWVARDRDRQRYVCEQPPYSMLAHLESHLPAADVILDQALLDRIDEIVPPGTNINPADGGWANPALEPAARRG